MDEPQSQAASGELITDDFAPVNLYDTMRTGSAVATQMQKGG